MIVETIEKHNTHQGWSHTHGMTQKCGAYNFVHCQISEQMKDIFQFILFYCRAQGKKHIHFFSCFLVKSKKDINFFLFSSQKIYYLYFINLPEKQNLFKAELLIKNGKYLL